MLKIEPWFNSRYIEEQIPLVFKEEWNQTFAVDESLFHLPAPNKFIPSSFKPRDHSGDDLSTQILVNEPCMKIWYKCDVGLAYAHFIIYLHDKNENVKNQLMVKMFLKLLEDALSEIIFQVSTFKLVRDTFESFRLTIQIVIVSLYAGKFCWPSDFVITL